MEILLTVESADRNAKDLQKTQLPAVNALSPQAKSHSRAPPQASGATPCMRALECYGCSGPQNLSIRTLNANSLKRRDI